LCQVEEKKREKKREKERKRKEKNGNFSKPENFRREKDNLCDWSNFFVKERNKPNYN
jgi:hypothetical protein